MPQYINANTNMTIRILIPIYMIFIVGDLYNDFKKRGQNHLSIPK